MKKTILVVGASSVIAQAFAKNLAVKGHDFVLVGRDLAKLDSVAADLRVRGAVNVLAEQLDFNDLDHHEQFLRKILTDHPQIETAIICHGLLGNQQETEREFEKFHEIIRVNFLSYVSLLLPISSWMAERRKGSLVVIGSVAGDRGRQSNFTYGAAKGGLATYCQGLRNKLFHHKVHLLFIKPGFVDSPMTAHLKKGILWSQPNVIGNDIVRALNRKKNVVYLPGFWIVIMMIIKGIPEFIFKRLRL